MQSMREGFFVSISLLITMRLGARLIPHSHLSPYFIVEGRGFIFEETGRSVKFAVNALGEYSFVLFSSICR